MNKFSKIAVYNNINTKNQLYLSIPEMKKPKMKLRKQFHLWQYPKEQQAHTQ